MIYKRFAQIDRSYIDDLILNGVSESINLDYKQDLILAKDDDKKEFLADVSSFANAAGGDLIYGISEKRDEQGKTTGIPEKSDGLSANGQQINADEEIKKIECLIRDGIEPRMSSYQIKAIEGFEKGPVIFLRVAKSWMPPHMVKLKGSQRFFTRKDRIRYPLDIIEIRNAVLLSDSLVDKIRQFRDGRLARIIADETPITLHPHGKFVVHIVPISGLYPTTQIDIKSIEIKDLLPLGGSGCNYRINFDGLLTYQCNQGVPACNNYLQLFRNGAIETVDSCMLGNIKKWGKKIPTDFEQKLIPFLKSYLKFAQDIGAELPIFVMISLVGVKGYAFHGGFAEIDKDSLILPDILVEDYNSEPALFLRPAFDTVWQSAGYIGSPNYGDNGRRTENSTQPLL